MKIEDGVKIIRRKHKMDEHEAGQTEKATMVTEFSEAFGADLIGGRCV